MTESPNSRLLSKPLVVKLGGSLYEHVPELVRIFQQSPRAIFIVPGGGRFADAVRKTQIPDEDAHWMAIRAMNQYGEYVGSYGLPTTDLLEIPKKTVVFLPFRSTRHFDPLPHSWDITSDTIAAWIAGRLGLELLILKSVNGIWINGSYAETITDPIETVVVDPCCIPYILKHGIMTTIINGSSKDTVIGFLRGETVSCTRIGTTF